MGYVSNFKVFNLGLELHPKERIRYELMHDSFNKYFKCVIPLLDDYPQLFLDNPKGKLATIYAKEWQYNNKFCLMGDAAHAIVPFFGQGMNASFEDCEVLMKCIDDNSGQLEQVFKKYNKIRKIDGHAIANMAIENYIEMRDLVTKKEFIRQKELSNILWKKFPDRFIPRYNMVSFTSIPYSEVLKRGKIQKEIIKKINLNSPDIQLAEKLIKENLVPITC